MAHLVALFVFIRFMSPYPLPDNINFTIKDMRANHLVMFKKLKKHKFLKTIYYSQLVYPHCPILLRGPKQIEFQLGHIIK